MACESASRHSGCQHLGTVVVCNRHQQTYARCMMDTQHLVSHIYNCMPGFRRLLTQAWNGRGGDATALIPLPRSFVRRATPPGRWPARQWASGSRCPASPPWAWSTASPTCLSSRWASCAALRCDDALAAFLSGATRHATYNLLGCVSKVHCSPARRNLV